MAEKTRLVLWRHPKMGLMADLPDGTRQSSLDVVTIRKLVERWLRDHQSQ